MNPVSSRPAAGPVLSFLVLASALVLILGGCGQGTEGASGTGPGGSGGDSSASSDDAGGESDLPNAIACGTQYRPDAEQLEGAESPTLTVNRDDSLTGSSATHEFPTMTLDVTYVGDAPEGRTVRVSVTADDGAPLFETLYQIGIPLQDIEFSGGHGFTGLNYVYHGQAMLQLWCEASA